MTRWHSPPAELYRLVEDTPGTVLLESAAPAPADSHPAPPPPTRLFTAPLRICVANHPAELPHLFAEIERAVASGLYAAGYFSYECAAFFEPRAATPGNLPAAPIPQPLAQPVAWFGIYSQPQIFDHQSGAFPKGDPPALADFRSAAPSPHPSADSSLDCTLALTEHEYAQRIEAIHEFIRSGDVYQLNFTVPLRVHVPGSSAALHQRLRARQPVPYAAFLHTQHGHRILSFSPELFFRVDSLGETRRITTRPMKGTAPRGRTTSEDRAQANWLRSDPKNRAENVMIVDLLRNDLGRLCAFGTVRAHDLFAVERYPTLWQMTSTVTGQLRPEVGFQQIFRALFPCGSITGAPKIRAMQLIAQLEAQPRGVYTGAIGFFSKEETVFNVAIRTLSLDGDRGVMGVGSGIVIDSDPAAEFRECLLKAEFLTSSSTHPSPDSFSLVETMLWQGEYPLLDLHLDRLEDSARYFAFPFNRAQVQAALQSHVETFTLCASERVLSLSMDPASETWESNPPTPPILTPPQEVGAPSLRHLSVARVGNHDPQSALSPANSLTRHPRAAGANLLPPSETPRKVRLLLPPDGSLQITSEPLPSITTPAHPLRIRIAADRTDPHDPMYFHKTTRRPLYAHALQAANAAGFDDVLFLNHRGEVTEAAMHNIFIEKAGRLLTPPVACGLLPGVHRRHTLATSPNAEERVLVLQDLQQADAIYLSNAVRGLREATIDWQAP
ncbi:MAG TPA: aminodeoxychorismate synthase component I [Terracidiphilus sp.]|nr:aminodeoxychorismate synthase component I [Terracidiphilus sp.]